MTALKTFLVNVKIDILPTFANTNIKKLKTSQITVAASIIYEAYIYVLISILKFRTDFFK